MTVTTMDRKLARLTEPFAPRPDLRIDAVTELASAGVAVGVIANPVLPLITDSERNLQSVAEAAKKAGADQFGANVLFLMPSAQRSSSRSVAERFPQHLKRYDVSFASGAYLEGRLSTAYPRHGPRNQGTSLAFPREISSRCRFWNRPVTSYPCSAESSSPIADRRYPQVPESIHADLRPFSTDNRRQKRDRDDRQDDLLEIMANERDVPEHISPA